MRLQDNTLPLKRKNQQWFDRLTILGEVEGTIFSFVGWGLPHRSGGLKPTLRLTCNFAELITIRRSKCSAIANPPEALHAKNLE